MSDIHQTVLKSMDEIGQRVTAKLQDMDTKQRELADRLFSRLSRRPRR